MPKCENCGLEAPIWEWKMAETQGVTKVPNELMKQIEQRQDTKAELTFLAFKILGRAGMMPYHSTDYACPRCNTPISKTVNRA